MKTISKKTNKAAKVTSKVYDHNKNPDSLNENDHFILTVSQWENTKFSKNVKRHFESVFSRYSITWDSGSEDTNAVWPASKASEFYRAIEEFMDEFTDLSFSLYVGIPYKGKFTIVYMTPVGFRVLLQQEDEQFWPWIMKFWSECPAIEGDLMNAE